MVNKIDISSICQSCDKKNTRRVKLKAFNFKNFTKEEKSVIRENRESYGNVLDDKFKPKGKFIFKSFEKFYISVFDHLISFLKGVKDKNKEKDLICDQCSKIVENDKQFVFSKLPEILSFGFSYNSYDKPSKNRITTKIDESIDISSLLYQEDENKVDFETSLNNFNTKKGKNPKTVLSQKRNIYNLKGVVQLKDRNIDDLSFVQYVKIKGKWWIIDNNKQELYTKPLNFSTSSSNPVVFCFYERTKETTPIMRNIKSQMTIKSSMKNEIDLLSIPDDFVYKLLYTNVSPSPSLDFFFCKHKKLKPLYNDIYDLRTNILAFNNNNSFPFSGKKKFNKELEEYRIMKKRNLSYGFSNVDCYKKPSKGKSKKLIHSNVDNGAFINFEEEGEIDCSYTRLYYLANSTDLPKPVAEYLIEQYNNTKKGFNKFDSSFYAKKCLDCTKNAKKNVIFKILQKSLFVDLLDKKSTFKYLIDINWFKRFKNCLLSDMKNGNVSRDPEDNLFFDKFNKEDQIGEDHDSLVLDNFVEVNLYVFLLLNEIYSCDKVITKDRNNVEITNIETMKKRIVNLFSKDEYFIYELLTKFMKFNTLKPRMNSFQAINRSKSQQLKSLNSIEATKLEDLVFDSYDSLLGINKKINLIINNKIKNNYSLFDNKGDSTDHLSVYKNISKITKTFGSCNLDAMNFSPCRLVKEIIEKGIKTVRPPSNIAKSINTPNQKRLMTSNPTKDNVVNSIDSQYNELENSPMTNQKKITKTKTYLEKIELSQDNTKINNYIKNEEDSLKISKIGEAEEEQDNNRDPNISDDHDFPLTLKKHHNLDTIFESGDENDISMELKFNVEKPKASFFGVNEDKNEVFGEDPDFQEEQEGDITLNSISSSISHLDSKQNPSKKGEFKEDNDSINIEVPQYQEKSQKASDKEINAEGSFTQMPSKKSHFSKLGSNFVVSDNSDDDSIISMNSNINRNMERNMRYSGKLARENVKRIFRNSLKVMEKKASYVIKAKPKPKKQGFMLIIHKKPKKSVVDEVITFEESKLKGKENKNGIIIEEKSEEDEENFDLRGNLSNTYGSYKKDVFSKLR